MSSPATTRFEPELGQALFATQAWGDHPMPRYADALFQGLLNEIERVYWNVNQKEWESHDDPEIPGIEWRSYWWGSEDAPEATLPNFKFGDVEIRFYKHPGRSNSSSVKLSPKAWAEWYESALDAIWDADRLPGSPDLRPGDLNPPVSA
jgi:hypothetical protein